MEEQSEAERALQRELRKRERIRKGLDQPKPRAEKQPKNHFELAQESIDRAIGQLVEVLRDDDRTILEQVVKELFLLGNRAVGPLASTLRRSHDLNLKARALEVLVHLAKQEPAAVMEVLNRTWQDATNPQVRQMANAGLQRVLFGRALAQALENEADRLRRAPSS